MAKIARIADLFTCGDIIVTGSGNVFINNMPAARQGDITASHAGYNTPRITKIINGSSSVFINNKPVALVGVSGHSGHKKRKKKPHVIGTPIRTGSPDVEAN